MSANVYTMKRQKSGQRRTLEFQAKSKMGTADDANKSLSTDNEETQVLGEAPASPGTNPGTAPGVPPGATLLNDRYLLVRQLNAGGFGTVHLAYDQQMHGRPVVVKIQIDQRVDDPWFERKFSEEVRALSLLDHPSVVVAFDTGRTPEGKPFLVMQYVDGVTLRAVMTPEGMPLDRVAAIVQQLGDALGAAHDKGIWHRDLKPENVMLQTTSTGADRVRLIDFGIATIADVKSKYQTNTRVAGSVLYMAPEQSIGQPSALTDIYALGLIAYEMATGRRPFNAENALQMLTMQQSPVRVRPSDLRPSLPPAAEHLILQSLDPDPARRPQKAALFGKQLHDALLGVTSVTPAPSLTTIAPPPPPPPSPPAQKRFRKQIAISIGITAILWSMFSNRKKSSPPSSKHVTVETQEKSSSDTEDEIELTYWNSVKDSTEPQLYREYLDKYPEGRFASLANAKIDILTRKSTASKQNASPSEPAATRTESPPAAQTPGIQIPGINISGLKLENIQAELAFWNSVKDSDDPRIIEEYLKKFPNGMFASLARLKLAAPEGRGRHGSRPPDQEPPGTLDSDERGRGEHHKLPPPRPPISLSDYTGPMEGQIQWTGHMQNKQGLVIQGGEVSSGSVSGSLPRVPITVDIPGGKATVLVPPTPANRWDHLSLRNFSGEPLTSLVIHWKVVKQ